MLGIETQGPRDEWIYRLVGDATGLLGSRFGVRSQEEMQGIHLSSSGLLVSSEDIALADLSSLFCETQDTLYFTWTSLG